MVHPASALSALSALSGGGEGAEQTVASDQCRRSSDYSERDAFPVCCLLSHAMRSGSGVKKVKYCRNRCR